MSLSQYYSFLLPHPSPANEDLQLQGLPATFWTVAFFRIGTTGIQNKLGFTVLAFTSAQACVLTPCSSSEWRLITGNQHCLPTGV